MAETTEIKTKDIEELLAFFGKNTYRARESSAKTDQILSKCLELWKLDYKCMVVPNIGGELCNSYPNQVIIPECEVCPEGLEPPELLCPLTLTSPSPLNLASPSSFIPGGSAPSFSSVVSGGPLTSISVNGHPLSSSPIQKSSASADGNKNLGESPTEAQSNSLKLREFILKAKFARCRARFPVPVILYKGNYICRSATLSGGPEMYGRSGIEYLFAAASSKGDEDEDEEATQTNSDWQLFDRVRSQDIKLLKACRVGVIVDLMVEKKKVKFGMYVTSSEKVDKENRYSDFSIVSLPYPGCEFFKEFRDLGYNGEGLNFNWSQAFVDAQLVIPERTMSAKVAPDWNNYRKWDLVRLSQNYLKLLLTYTYEGSQGLLVHCISGWDRTPLFISLIRLSLWADGLIHSSLDVNQILYLTIAYDWMAFGHDLHDRLCKGEEIFFFCFYFLKFIESEDYTVGRKRHMSNDSVSSDRLEGCVLLDVDGLSSAGSSNSLNSSCSSNRSSHHAPPVYFKAEKTGDGCDGHGVNLSWPYGSFTGELDFDDMSPNLSRASSASSSNKGSFARSSLREGDIIGATSEGRLSVRQTPVSGNVRTSSDNLKNGNSNTGSLHEMSKSHVYPIRSHNGQSDSSGESVGSLDRGSFSNIRCKDPPHASTSPMAVPVPRGRLPPRQRQESGSSVGSWQFVSGTGSFRGSTGSGNHPGSANSRSSRSSVPTDLMDSATTIKEEGSVESDQSIIVFNRAERLAKVRAAFYNVYFPIIGFNYPGNRNESGFGNLVSNFAQKVGIRPSRNT